ncbi:MAG: Holliday junction branch migration protein RuvA [Acidobacteria bacterium]|nr:Holliday junction branch migration protein RuvA [Acidobacteriota bacterium]
MIGSLTGRLIESEPGEVLVEAGGVGYRVTIPLTTFSRLPAPGSTVTLSIHTHVREDAIALFGFDTRPERDLFEKLIGVPGIGPRLATGLLSHLEPADLVQTIRFRDTARLTQVPGVGAKTAERIVLELSGALNRLPAAFGPQASRPGSGRRGDLMSALENLGYRAVQIAPAVEETLAAAGEADPLEGLLRDTLRRLAKSPRRPSGAGAESIPAAGAEVGPKIARRNR